MSSITLENGTLIYQSEYHAGLVAALKAAIPATDRKWDGGRKAWLVAPAHGATLAKLTAQFLGENIGVPRVAANTSAPETRILEVRYLGTTKDRGDGQRSAFAYIGGAWAAVFPEKALRDWFNAEARPDEEQTLYAVLGIPAAVSASDLKTAYRRLALQWHPDRCREPDAADQFRRIQHAYDVLREPRSRAKYDAGLALAATLNRGRGAADTLAAATIGYRSPLRCGLVMCEGRETLGRFVVDKILAWTDITDGQGRVLVVSWPRGADRPLESWS